MASESSGGPTPNGGVRSTITYLDGGGREVERAAASGAVIDEYDADGNSIHRTYATINGGQKPAAGDNPNDVIAAALATARAEGDEHAAEVLTNLLDHPAEAAALVAHLAGPTGAPA